MCTIRYAIKNGTRLNIAEHNGHAVNTLKILKTNKEDFYGIKSEVMVDSLPVSQKRVLKRIIHGKMSG